MCFMRIVHSYIAMLNLAPDALIFQRSNCILAHHLQIRSHRCRPRKTNAIGYETSEVIFLITLSSRDLEDASEGS